jgi:hypothetical protein
MAKETLLNAAVLRLRSALLETYATIESTLQTRVEAGDAQTLATKAIELGQLEMAIAVLEKNRENLLIPPEEEPTVVEVEEEAEDMQVSGTSSPEEADELVKRFNKSRKFHQPQEDE